MTGRPGASLYLRAEASESKLERLRRATERVLGCHPDARFDSLFFDAAIAVDPNAAAALRHDLDAAGRLAPLAEVTWHGDPGPESAVAALGTTRRSFTRMPSQRIAGPIAIELDHHALKKAKSLAWLRGLKKLGVVHLGLRGHRLPVDQVSQVDQVAQQLGFERYEAANWALAGHAARWLVDCRRGGPVMGIGPEAFGLWPDARRVHGEMNYCWFSPAAPAWRLAIDQGHDCRGLLQAQPPFMRACALLIGGVRLAEGVDWWGMDDAARRAFEEVAPKQVFDRLIAAGRVRVTKGRIAAVDMNEAEVLADEIMP